MSRDLIVLFTGGTSGIGSLEIIRIIDEKLEMRGFPSGTFSDLLYEPKTIVSGTSTERL